MKKHVKNYFKYFDYICQEEVFCEICHMPAQDLHHIEYGRFKRSDEVENIIALCRPHHEDAHKSILSREQLQLIHEITLNKAPLFTSVG